MDNVFGAFSILFLGCGIYGFYAWIKMKKTGEINETLLLGRNYSEYDCKDKAGYLTKALPAVLVFAITATLYGLIDMIHYYVTPMQTADTIAMVVFLVVIIWFMLYTSKLRKIYF